MREQLKEKGHAGKTTTFLRYEHARSTHLSAGAYALEKAAHFEAVQEQRITKMNIMPDGMIRAAGCYPYSSRIPIEFAMGLMRPESAAVTQEGCDLILETANNCRLVSVLAYAVCGRTAWIREERKGPEMPEDIEISYSSLSYDALRISRIDFRIPMTPGLNTGISNYIAGLIIDDQVDYLESLLGDGFSPDQLLFTSEPCETTSLLGYAAGHGSVEMVRRLLTIGADPNRWPGRSPLSALARRSECRAQLDIAALLLEAGENIEVADQDGLYPIAYASARGYRQLANMFHARARRFEDRKISLLDYLLTHHHSDQLAQNSDLALAVIWAAGLESIQSAKSWMLRIDAMTRNTETGQNCMWGLLDGLCTFKHAELLRQVGIDHVVHHRNGRELSILLDGCVRNRWYATARLVLGHLPLTDEPAVRNLSTDSP